jgi:acetylornithine deacetylase
MYSAQIIEQSTVRAVELLKQIIAIPSYSREESKIADFIVEFAKRDGLKPYRNGNNIWCVSSVFTTQRPTLLLNAHIDTVRPVNGWTHDPHIPHCEGEKLYGLGSNDCGGGLVALYEVFRLCQSDENLPWNLIYLASAEEEVSGCNGIESILPDLPKIDVSIVGEPTNMQPAIAEKGLMVIDATAHGIAGHAARDEGVNAIYKALEDILWCKSYHFDRVSSLLGEVKMSVTIIQAGTQHNVVPDECLFTIDVRSNECYSNQEIIDEIGKNLHSSIKARSTRLNSSHIAPEHPLVQKCTEMGKIPFGSPTLSDQALMPFPSLKIGPGDSARSHTADEYIKISEIHDGIADYLQLISQTKLCTPSRLD